VICHDFFSFGLFCKPEKNKLKKKIDFFYVKIKTIITKKSNTPGTQKKRGQKSICPLFGLFASL
jgi:hypothetical protein